MSASHRDAGAGQSEAIFAALGDGTRLRLVSALCTRGPSSIARLTDGSGVTRQAVTKHLRVLADAGLVRSTRRGRETIWAFDPERVADARRYLDAITRQWNDVLRRLKEFVERDDA